MATRAKVCKKGGQRLENGHQNFVRIEIFPVNLKEVIRKFHNFVKNLAPIPEGLDPLVQLVTLGERVRSYIHLRQPQRKDRGQQTSSPVIDLCLDIVW